MSTPKCIINLHARRGGCERA